MKIYLRQNFKRTLARLLILLLIGIFLDAFTTYAAFSFDYPLTLISEINPTVTDYFGQPDRADITTSHDLIWLVVNQPILVLDAYALMILLIAMVFLGGMILVLCFSNLTGIMLDIGEKELLMFGALSGIWTIVVIKLIVSLSNSFVIFTWIMADLLWA